MAGIEIAQVDPSTDRLSAEKILAVQRSAYAVEAELIGDDRIPLLHESVDDLCAAQVHWLVALDLDEILGAAAWSGPRSTVWWWLHTHIARASVERWSR